MAEIKKVTRSQGHKATSNEDKNYIKFLGTAGARFVMIKQLRSSGGIWISYKGTNAIIDPGPGSIVRCAMSRPRIDPTKLDGVILTHRHLDHANDTNVMIEAMTEGGFKRRGVIFMPQDAAEEEPVISKHLRNSMERIEILKEKGHYQLGGIKFETPSLLAHPVLTYGLRFNFKQPVSFITDTRYFDGLENLYKADIIVINVVFYESMPGIDHLSFGEVKEIIKRMRPKTAVLTHFGMTMLKARPHILAQELSDELNMEVIAAYDGMKFSLT
jgi:phosphoribosyl 1,2-cyclic phosphodiesterase